MKTRVEVFPTTSVKDFLEEELKVSRRILEKNDNTVAWGHSSRSVDMATNKSDLHWPRVVLIQALLLREMITESDLTLVRQGTLTLRELENN